MRSKWTLLACAAIGTVIQACPAQALAKRYDIAAGEASRTLAAFAHQAGLQLVAPSADLHGQRTVSVRGEMPVERALQTMLRSTNLSATISNGTIIVRKIAPIQTRARTLLIPAAVTAQATVAEPQLSDAEASPGLEDIVVTATRREESLRDVPIAVAAFSQQTMETRQINDLTSLQTASPSLSVAPLGDPTTQIVALRGQVATDILVTTDPAVGIYLDGVYIARATGGNLGFVDVARVEVLRGPQGTLFGRNTIGGAVSVITNQPRDTFEAKVTATYGNFNRFDLTGVVNVPIGDNLAIRLVGNHRQRDGFARSALTGAELNAVNMDYGRAALRWDVSPSWSVTLNGDYTDSRTDGQWITILKSYPSAERLATLVSGGTQTVAQYVGAFNTRPLSSTTGPSTSRSWGLAGTIEGKFGSADFKSITAYRKMHRNLVGLDQDGTPFDLLQVLGNDTRQNQFSQELQLYGKAMDGRFDWIVGAYVFREEGRDAIVNRSQFPLFPNATVTDGSAINKSLAVYAQASYDLTDQFEVFAGLRYTRDRRGGELRNRTIGPNLASVVSCNTAGATAPDCLVVVPATTTDYFPFTFGVNYKPSAEILIYGKWSRGFRAGGFNVRATNSIALAPFSPEKLDSYEIGTKIDIDRVFRVNIAAFLSKFDDIQASANIAIANGATASTIQNAGKATIKGVELEASAAIGRLTLSGSIAMTDAHYDMLRPSIVGINLQSPFPLTPEVAWSTTADYDVPVGIGQVNLHADYSYRTRTFFAPAPPADRDNSQPAYGLLNGSITLRMDSGISLGVFGRNLTDKKYLQRTINTQGSGFLMAYPGDPRTYGITASYSF